MISYWKMMSKRNVKNGASCRMTLSTMPQTSMPQQQLLQQSVGGLLRKCLFSNAFICSLLNCHNTYSSFRFELPPRGLRALVAESTIVNCNRLQDHIPKVKYTKSGIFAMDSSLYESKNSIISAAVP